MTEIDDDVPTKKQIAGALLMGVIVVCGSSCRILSAPRYRGPISDHFDGERFHNEAPLEERGFRDLLRWQLHRNRGPWEPRLDAPPGPPPPVRMGRGEIRVTFVNHATVLLQVDGLNILTDPIWSERASPFSWLGPKRFLPPGIRFEDLPPIDAVLISHSHYDHLDLPTLERLDRTFHPRFIVGLGTRALLERAGIAGAVDLDWWQHLSLSSDVTLTMVPVQHWSNRGLADRSNLLWGGYVLEGPSGTTFFAGDTGFGPHYQQVRDRFGPVRLAILPIGAYEPRWFMKDMHMNPADAVQAHRVLEASTSVGIHHRTFRLTDEGQEEPERRLRFELERAGIPADRFWVLKNGEGRDVPPR
jgi:L-ascorbate metabolism protein UlaG (beta-lactamase superfamily)